MAIQFLRRQNDHYYGTTGGLLSLSVSGAKMTAAADSKLDLPAFSASDSHSMELVLNGLPWPRDVPSLCTSLLSHRLEQRRWWWG